MTSAKEPMPPRRPSQSSGNSGSQNPPTPPRSGGGSTPAPTPPAPPTPPTAPAPTVQIPLRSPADVDLKRFNDLVGDWAGKPVEDMKRLFIKQVILDDQTTINVETIKVPGYIGISDPLSVTDASGKKVSAHEDAAKCLSRDGLYICTYQWHKERYGVPMDTRRAMDKDTFTEAFMKNEGHHSGALVPAKRPAEGGTITDSFGTFNEPNDYHRGMYGKDGFVSVAQRLVFPSFVTAKQARGYTDSIICWMAMMNPFVKFPADYNGGDPTHVSDRAKLKELMKNSLLASLGDPAAKAFFDDPLNKCYCAEFMFVALNTPVFPFNKKGLMELLGDAQKVDKILAMQTQHNNRQETILSKQTSNPEFKKFTIPMPVVPEDLPPLDVLLKQNGQTVDSNSLPFPPFKISQVIRRAYRTLLPRTQAASDKKIAEAQARMFKFMEPALLQQMGLEGASPDDPKVIAVQQFVDMVSKRLDKPYTTYEEFDKMVDEIMVQADQMLVGSGDRMYFVPPRIYVDLGQNDGDNNLPQGWGFRLETVGGMVARGVFK